MSSNRHNAIISRDVIRELIAPLMKSRTTDVAMNPSARSGPLRSHHQKNRLNIAIVTQYFPPDKPGRIPEQVASELVARGHSVKVLTTYPHFTYGRVSHGYRQKIFTDELYRGISVRRVPIIPSHSRNPIGRIANYLSFAASARIANRFLHDVDVVYVHGTPATVAEPARALAKSRGIPFVYHVQDIWPESVTESEFLPPRVLGVLKSGINRWLSRVYNSASAVIAIAPTAQNVLIERGVAADRTHLVYNWSDAVPAVRNLNGEGLSLLYAGTLGNFQDLDTVVEAAIALADFPNFRLKIAGTGVAEKRLKSLVSSLGLKETVEFLGHINPEDMAKLYAWADFQIVSLRSLDFFRGTIPSKFQTGLANGVPVITTVQGDVSQLVIQNGLGLVAEPENAESVTQAMKTAYAMSIQEKEAYSERAIRFFEQTFTKEKAIDKIESILLQVAETGHQQESKQ